MKFRAVVKREEEFDLKMFHTICSEILEDYPQDSLEDLTQKCYKEMLNTFIEDFGYEIISVNEEDKNKLLYWIKQTIKDLREEEQQLYSKEK